MATKTRRQLVDQVLANLGVLTPGQIASDEDVATIDGYIDAVIEGLEQRNIASIDNPNAIEARHFLSLAVCVADAAKYEFGGGQFDVMNEEQKLRHMSRSGPTYEVMKAQYF